MDMVLAYVYASYLFDRLLQLVVVLSITSTVLSLSIPSQMLSITFTVQCVDVEEKEPTDYSIQYIIYVHVCP